MSVTTTWAAIFDFDGVLVDSALCHRWSWEKLAEEEGKLLLEGSFEKGFGRRNAYIIPKILQWTEEAEEVARLSKRKEELYREFICEKGIEPLPGVVPWLEKLQENKIPCVIGSSTDRLNLEVVLKEAGIDQFFDQFVSAEDVTIGKPDPEVFLKGAEKIGIKPERCVVFEDALVGIEAAHAAGMKVVAVATSHPAEKLGEADRVVNRLDELSVEEIRNLVT